MKDEKVSLTPEQQTMLITLFSKVHGCPKAFYEDTKAWEILSQVDYDFEALKVPKGTNLTVCLRAIKLDECVQEFLAEHPKGRVVHLGCGLDSRCCRVAHPEADWLDLDLPEVIELRRKFYKPTAGYTMLSGSVTTHAWMDEIPRDGRQTFVAAEGLMMYLAEGEVKALILALRDRFGPCRLVFDAFSTLTVRNISRHPSIRATGAKIQWGVDDPGEIEAWGDGIQLVEEWFFNRSDHLSHLSWGNRLMFWLAGLFPAALKAQRILVFNLTPVE